MTTTIKTRVSVGKSAADGAEGALPHVLADGVRRGDALNLVVYSDWAYDGGGWTDLETHVRYVRTHATVELTFPPSSKARVLTLSRATGEGFETVRGDVPVAAGTTTCAETLELSPMTAYSISIR
jgi:hypothetical protein